MMTHEELLAEINMLGETSSIQSSLANALSAAVELHKPVMAFTGGYDWEENELWQEQCKECSNNGFSQVYPCQTIQAIEKELK